ncbi:MAG TPA: ABC transporter permease [Longimicrobium sp.]|jgi:predicted permease
MPFLPRLQSLWRNLRHRDHVERELDEELRAYVDLLADEKVRAGMPPARARRAAFIEAGVEPTREAVRDVRAGAWADAFARDVRFALRMLRRSPLFSATAIVALALGIGANAALFSLARALLVQGRPGVGSPDELVWVAPVNAESGWVERMSYPSFLRLRGSGGPFAALAATRDAPFALSGRGEPEQVDGQFVSGSYFAMLRTPFAVGRGFAPAEDLHPGAHPVAVIGHTLWQRRFGGDPGIVGRTVAVNGVPVTVVGVAAEGFLGVEQDVRRRDLWLPMAMLPALFPTMREALSTERGATFSVVGRLRPGATTAEADAALAAATGVLTQADPARSGSILRTFPAGAGIPPGANREIAPVAALSAVVTGLVLLIACANVSSMLLGRGFARRREIGVRLSLGAGRGRLVRQLLTESLVLSLAGALLGVAVAFATVHAVTAFAIPLPLEPRIDFRALAATLVLAVGAALVFGVAPALAATRADLTGALKDGALSGTPRRARLQGALVVAQLALALFLLITSGLFLRSLDKANRVDVGLDTSAHVLALSFDLGLLGYDAPRARAFVDAAIERAAALPGVRSATASDVMPLEALIAVQVDVDGAPAARGGPMVLQTTARPGYFQTVGVRLAAGRDFGPRDVAGAPPVAVVSRSFAEHYLPGRSPIGARLRLMESTGPLATVVGVAEDVRATGPSGPPAHMVYLPQLQHVDDEPGSMTLLVRSDGDARALAPALRRELRALDPHLPIYAVRTLGSALRQQMMPQRTGSTLLAVFGTLALVLATVGVYASMAFAVTQRTHEIAVRMALGGDASRVVRLFVGRGARLTLAGLAIGVALALAGSRLFAALLLGIAPTDLLTFAAVSALLFGVAIVACWIPARRAVHVHPMQVLRHE